MNTRYSVILSSLSRKRKVRNSLSKTTIHILMRNISFTSAVLTAYVPRMFKNTYIAFVKN